MGPLEHWGNALVKESLREAADTFFSARKALEDDIAFLEQHIEIVRRQVPKIQGWFAGLNYMLGSVHDTQGLFTTVGVLMPDDTFFALQTCNLRFHRPRSLTRKSLFAKTVWEIYAQLAELIDRYTHGTYAPDPTLSSRMLLSINMHQLRALCAELNQRIITINESNRPSESLGFAKRLDQARIAQESATGGGGETWTLDEELSFPALDCNNLGLPSYPELPTDTTARDALISYCRSVYSTRSAHADAVLAAIQDPDDKRGCLLQRP